MQSASSRRSKHCLCEVGSALRSPVYCACHHSTSFVPINGMETHGAQGEKCTLVVAFNRFILVLSTMPMMSNRHEVEACGAEFTLRTDVGWKGGLELWNLRNFWSAECGEHPPIPDLSSIHITDRLLGRFARLAAGILLMQSRLPLLDFRKPADFSHTKKLRFSPSYPVKLSQTKRSLPGLLPQRRVSQSRFHGPKLTGACSHSNTQPRRQSGLKAPCSHLTFRPARHIVLESFEAFLWVQSGQ